MSEPRIGRVLVASLHQAIAELLPDRLEFYENWLSVSGLREGTIGLAPLHAVLSFLRGEGDIYAAVVARAGECAADWTVSSLPVIERRLLRTLPLRLRTRAALRSARSLIRATYPGSRAIIRFRKDTASVDLRGSLFCEVREISVRPLCGYYAAAVSKVLEHFAVPAETRLDACRAAGGGQGCLMSVIARPPAGSEPATAAMSSES
jgi:bacteriochlorophyll 4-vinyl reductase